MKNKYVASFSLVEVLIFTTIFSLFFVTAAAVVTASLRTMKLNEHKILATRYGEELLEWIRGEKETDWYLFSTTYTPSDSTDYTYCFNDSLTMTWPAAPGGDCLIFGLNPAIFKRTAILQSDTSRTQIAVTVNVKWDEYGVEQTVPFKTVLSVYEN